MRTRSTRLNLCKELVADMRAGKVDLLVILGGNPVYDAPADLGFADALKNANIPLRVHLGLYQNETAQLCHWHVNAGALSRSLGRCPRLRRHGQSSCSR